jgi:hypothetical protein
VRPLRFPSRAILSRKSAKDFRKPTVSYLRQNLLPDLLKRPQGHWHFLGVTWDSPVRSGLQSLAGRLDWQQSHDPTLKASLVAYNRDDCIALTTILFHLSKIIRDANSRADIEFPYSPKRVATDTGAEVHNTFQSVLRSAHFSYARSRIKISSAKRDQAAHSKKEDRKKRPRRKAFSSIKGTVVQAYRCLVSGPVQNIQGTN